MLGCIVQARMSSSRLPGKVMLPLKDKKPILFHVIKQLQYSKLIKKIVVATSKNSEDDVIETYLKEIGIECFRGSLNDLIDRHYQCAKKFNFSNIIRIPSDKPFIDPTIVDDTIKLFNSVPNDYSSNFPFPLKFNIGVEVEIFSFEALKKAWKYSMKSSEREHIFPYFHNHKDEFKILYSSNLEKFSKYRFTVDRIEDYDLIKLLVNKINKSPILISDIISLLEKNPELKKINENIKFDEGQLKSLKEEK